MPNSVILVPAPHRFTTARRLDIADRSPEITILDVPDGRHIVLHDHDGSHRLWLSGWGRRRRVAALVPLDGDVPLRLSGLRRLCRRLDGRSSGPVPRAWTITKRLRQRLLLMMRALDGRLAGASYREIGAALYGASAAAGSAWKTSSLRGQTIRLVKDGTVTMERDYRKLLRGSR